MIQMSCAKCIELDQRSPIHGERILLSGMTFRTDFDSRCEIYKMPNSLGLKLFEEEKLLQIINIPKLLLFQIINILK
jgi:hypothetical protein